MDMEVDKTHCPDLIEGSGDKPLFPNLAQLIDTAARIYCIYTKEKAHFFFIPPLRGFSPPIKNLFDSIEALSPDEGGYHGILVLVDFDWFPDEP
jgi:hypothetical protein